MTTVTLTQEQFDNLTALYPSINALKQSLEPVVSTKIIKEINKIQKAMEEVFKPFWEKDEVDFNTNYDALAALQTEHGLSSIWSLSEVPATSINQKMAGKVKKITYESWGPAQEIVFKTPKNMTWLQLWQEADKLIAQSGDSHHCFVEAFSEDKKNPGHYRLVTGS
jgi:hypothetical protein